MTITDASCPACRADICLDCRSLAHPGQCPSRSLWIPNSDEKRVSYLGKPCSDDTVSLLPTFPVLHEAQPPPSSLPEKQPTPSEELALYQLAQKLHFRRCPKCKSLIERSEGCKHMTCRCKYEFCHQCGSRWKNGCPGGCGGEWRNEPVWAEARVTGTGTASKQHSHHRLSGLFCSSRRAGCKPSSRTLWKERLRRRFHGAFAGRE